MTGILLYKIGISLSELNGILGLSLKEKEVGEILDRLGFAWKKMKPADEVLKTAEKLVGFPYKLGASVSNDAPKLFDCSSFVSYCFVQAGISLPRISVDQFVWGKTISENEAKAGDLVFSNSGKGRIYFESQEFLKGTKVPEGVDHVGICLGDGKVIHATNGKGVVIEELENSQSFKDISGFRRVINSDDERFVVSVPFERLDLRTKEGLAKEIGKKVEGTLVKNSK